MPGGLTPGAPPLDQVMNKVVKGHCRDLSDLYILTAPIGNTGNPPAPSRQLRALWVVPAWELIPAEWVRKSGTACGDKSEKHLRRSPAGTMVVFADAQVGTLVEEICGEALRSNCEDMERGPDPLPRSDEGCNSDESDNDGSGDDTIEEV